MFDTMTLTKIVGAFCGALLVFLLGGWVAETLYHTGGDHGEDHQQAYAIETGIEEVDESAPEVDVAELMASADAAAGERVFSKCKAYKLDGSNGTGPHLDGVVGRAVDSVDGFNYSGALEEVAQVWDHEHLFGFLANPKQYAPGTKMSFSGLPKDTDRANLIAYLETFSG